MLIIFQLLNAKLQPTLSKLCGSEGVPNYKANSQQGGEKGFNIKNPYQAPNI